MRKNRCGWRYGSTFLGQKSLIWHLEISTTRYSTSAGMRLRSEHGLQEGMESTRDPKACQAISRRVWKNRLHTVTIQHRKKKLVLRVGKTMHLLHVCAPGPWTPQLDRAGAMTDDLFWPPSFLCLSPYLIPLSLSLFFFPFTLPCYAKPTLLCYQEITH